MKAYDMDIEKNLENFEESASPNCLSKYGSSKKNIMDMDFFNTIPSDDNTLFDYVFGDVKPDFFLWNLNTRRSPSPSKSVSISSGERSAKKSLFDLDCSDEDEKIDLNSWMHKPKEKWNRTDTINWIIYVSTTIGHSYGKMSPSLALPGKELLLLSRQQFALYDRCFGEKLYDLLHDKRQDSTEFRSRLDGFPTDSEGETSTGLYSDSSDTEPHPKIPGKKKVGRPPLAHRKTKEPRKKLWEFIRDALLNPEYCPRIIRWDEYEEKTFRIVDTLKLAEIWGQRNKKEDSTMNYEKFSRAMRYYYKKGIFVSVPGRRLIYKFGKVATGLETDCPNFDPNYYANKVKSEH